MNNLQALMSSGIIFILGFLLGWTIAWNQAFKSGLTIGHRLKQEDKNDSSK